MNTTNYRQKYLKYKLKYLKLCEQIGGKNDINDALKVFKSTIVDLVLNPYTIIQNIQKITDSLSKINELISKSQNVDDLNFSLETIDAKNIYSGSRYSDNFDLFTLFKNRITSFNNPDKLHSWYPTRASCANITGTLQNTCPKLFSKKCSKCSSKETCEKCNIDICAECHTEQNKLATTHAQSINNTLLTMKNSITTQIKNLNTQATKEKSKK